MHPVHQLHGEHPQERPMTITTLDTTLGTMTPSRCRRLVTAVNLRLTSYADKRRALRDYHDQERALSGLSRGELADVLAAARRI